MPIDQYEYSFEYLVGTELPQHMVTLEQAMKISMAEFAVGGVGVAALTQRFGLEADFQGCYVLLTPPSTRTVKSGTPSSPRRSLPVMASVRAHSEALA
jgi:hypothetical protein